MDVHYLTGHWDSVRDGLLNALNKFTEADLDYRPFPDALSVRGLMLDIAHEEFGELHLGIKHDIHSFPPPSPPEAHPTLSEIKARLGAVHADTMEFIRARSDRDLKGEVVTAWGQTSRLIDLLGHILEHEIHHRGELSLILGLLGRRGLDA